MQDEKLPKYYKGYLTDELLKMWDQFKHGGIPEHVPEDKISAMRELLRKYRLAAGTLQMIYQTYPCGISVTFITFL